jgi:hypothetical protein
MGVETHRFGFTVGKGIADSTCLNVLHPSITGKFGGRVSDIDFLQAGSGSAVDANDQPVLCSIDDYSPVA